MRRNHPLAYFFAGFLLANALPHLCNGVAGSPFQTPFAHPPGQGLSSALVNVVWGFFNLAAGTLLLSRVGEFNPRNLGHLAACGLGFFTSCLVLAYAFAPLHGGL